MVININAISFSPVAYDIESGDDDDWVVSTQSVDIDDRVMGIFVGYLSRVINKEDTGKVTLISRTVVAKKRTQGMRQKHISPTSAVRIETTRIAYTRLQINRHYD
jgi:hypothetical protein